MLEQGCIVDTVTLKKQIELHNRLKRCNCIGKIDSTCAQCPQLAALCEHYYQGQQQYNFQPLNTGKVEIANYSHCQ